MNRGVKDRVKSLVDIVIREEPDPKVVTYVVDELTQMIRAGAAESRVSDSEDDWSAQKERFIAP